MQNCKKKMKIVAIASLAGGQGKTTVSIALAKVLSRMGYRVLLIDCDPQHSCTVFMGIDIEQRDATTFELFKGCLDGSKYSAPQWEDDFASCLYPSVEENLFVIPADNNLNGIHDFLAESGLGLVLLRQRLRPAQDEFDVCILDCPPQKSQITGACIGSSDYVIVPVETKEKGYLCLSSTLEAVEEISDMKMGAELPVPDVIGIVPFRLRMVGLNIPRNQRDVLKELGNVLQANGQPCTVFPAIVDSSVWEKAMGENLLPIDIDSARPELQQSIDFLAKAVASRLSPLSLPPSSDQSEEKAKAIKGSLV